MPLTSSASDVFGIGTLLLVILCCCAGSLCLAVVVFFHFKVGKQQQHLVLHDYDRPWVVRMVLAAFCVFWSLGELARLSWFRKGSGVLHSMGMKTQENLCRFYVVWSVGFTEPGLLLTVLFLVQGSLQVYSATRNLNCRVMTLMVLFGSPIFVLQLVLSVTGGNGMEKGFGGTVPAYFTNTFETDPEANQALCNYPLFSVMLLGLFSVVFAVYFFSLGVRMVHHVINRKLQMRAYWLVLAVMVLFPIHVVFLGLSVRIRPGKAAHEGLIFLGFLTQLLCATGAMGILVVLPVADALAVFLVLRRRDQTWHSASPIELSAAVSDDDESPRSVARRSLLGTISSTGTDAGSSRRDASLSLEINTKDLTLGPGGWLADISGSIPSSSLAEVPLSVL